METTTSNTPAAPGGLTGLLQVNYDRHASAMAAAARGDWAAATEHFTAGAETVGEIVRYWATTHEPSDERSWVSYWDVDGQRVVLRWRDRRLVATGDDGAANERTWHPDLLGEDASEEWVRYERYERDGRRVGHGYVHPVSRKLVQSG